MDTWELTPSLFLNSWTLDVHFWGPGATKKVNGAVFLRRAGRTSGPQPGRAVNHNRQPQCRFILGQDQCQVVALTRLAVSPNNHHYAHAHQLHHDGKLDLLVAHLSTVRATDQGVCQLLLLPVLCT